MTLLKPLRYVLIRHQAKAVYDGLLPLVIAVSLTVLVLSAGRQGAVFGREGYLAQLQNLLTILGGFFVAALTLITTADLPILKEPVGGRRPPTMPGEAIPLSRKRFLAYLFGYLSTSSFLLVGIGLTANLAAAGAASRMSPEVREVAKITFLLLYDFWLAHVFVATMLGMFYFTERLQISDRRARVGRRDGTPTPID